jgi:Domain of unknown function (DUF4384)
MCVPKRFFFMVALLLVLGFTASVGVHAQSPPGENNIGFLYAFGAYVGPQGKEKLIPVQSETTLRAGDRLKIFFEPKSDQYFYLLHISPQGELTPLYPSAAQTAKVVKGTQLFVPTGGNWFELDGHVGQEKFFFIATAERLERLEELCAHHLTLREKPDVQSSTDAILDEIKRLRQKHKPLSAPAEKPVRIGGSVRGEQQPSAAAFPDIAPLATEVTAPGFFTRTFSIDHR